MAPTSIPSAASRVTGASSTTAASAKLPAIRRDARVAVIGDSHTAGTFGAELGARLDRYTKAGGGKLLRLTGIPSASVSHFLTGTPTNVAGQIFRTPKITDVLKSKPDTLVVALGTNMLFGTKAANKLQIRKLLAHADAAGTKVVWVGPPDVRGFGGNLSGPEPERRFYEALREVNAARKTAGKKPMTIIDSRPSTRPSDTIDGVHFGGATARSWAKQVFTAATT